MEHKIDAENKILGRLATQVAILLRGKDRPTFDPTKLSGNKVTVYNVDKIRVTGKKLDQKIYRRHSGYHGGLKEEKLEDLLKRDYRQPLRKAVSGMLPKNKLRERMLKNLILLKENIK